MAKGTIGILTGGGDVPGLNPAIRAITIRALRDGYKVVGIRHGWGGLVDYSREKGADNSEQVLPLTEAIVNRAGRTGGTFLHTSRVRPSTLPKERVPSHLSGYSEKTNDITKDVIKNLEHIGVDVLIPIGGDDTLSYGKRLHDEGLNVVAIPKTMDNDVYGTDYCIGFSTCVTRTIELTHRLRTSAGSHQRCLVLGAFGRYAGVTALLPAMAGGAGRDALDSIVPMAFGNLALELVVKKQYGRLVSIHKGFYDTVPLASVTSEKKVVDVSKYYNTQRLRPIYQFDGAPLFIMTSD